MSISLIIIVCFIMVMFLWLLALLNVFPNVSANWLAWFACLFLGLVVFVQVSGTLNLIR